MPGESMCYDARIRYWEEEWLSRLLEDALRLKGLAAEPETPEAAKGLNAGRKMTSSD